MRAVTRTTRRGLLALGATILVGTAAGAPGLSLATRLATAAPRHAAAPLPDRIADADFWRLIRGMSEPDGYFRSDNLVSNELTFQHVIPELQRALRTGGVYLGVGPDQNFTYIAALQPRIAFIVDIRRGNQLQHLLYKALIEGAADRAAFLERLFSRPRPGTATRDASIGTLIAAFDSVEADSALLHRTLADVRSRLVDGHGFPLGAEDQLGIEYVLRAFFDAGPALTYSFGRGLGGYGSFGGYGWRGMPSYGQLMIQTDAQGVQHGYLADEAHFQRLKAMQERNLIVPVIGDFAGPKALRAVGDWLREHEATVSVIYTSNVEQYLFQGDDAWRRYYENVGTLPLDERTTWLRAVFNYGGYRDPGFARGPRSVTMMAGVQAQLAAVRAGQVQSYWDVVQFSRAPQEPAAR